MKVFLSHSMKDKELVNHLIYVLKINGIELYAVEHFFSNCITDKIKQTINYCDVAIILLTESGTNSKSVQAEIGYLNATNKTIIPVVLEGLENEFNCFLYGSDYITLQKKNIKPALHKFVSILLQIDFQQKEILKKQEQQKATGKLILGSAFAFLLLNAIIEK
jgi:hypothetical protein